MRMKFKIIFVCLCAIFSATGARSQWVVSDPGNLAQGIVNSAKQVVEAGKNGQTSCRVFRRRARSSSRAKRTTTHCVRSRTS